MTNTVTHRFASPRPWTAVLARWMPVVLPLVCGSVAVGDGGLVASSGVLGLASSLGALSDAEIQAIDVRGQSQAIAGESARFESQVLPRLPQALPARVARPGLPRVEEGEAPAAAPAVFRPARPRSASEMRAASEPVRMPAPAQQSPSLPSVKSPPQIDGPRPESSRPVTGDRPLPFSRLFSQVQY